MRKTRTLAFALIVALLLSLCLPAAYADSNEAYIYIEEADAGCAEENFTARTPSDEPGTLYVSGHVTDSTKAVYVGVYSADTECKNILRVFVFPDENHEFAFSVDMAAGNKSFPTAIKGTVVADEKGGRTNSRNCSTKPGYVAVPEVERGFFRILISKTAEESLANGIYDEKSDYGWSKATNPLGGRIGFACQEFILLVEDNVPRLISYPDVISHNAAVRFTDADDMTPGTAAWAEYTDVYLRDIENLMSHNGAHYPVTEEQAEYFAEVADELTQGVEGDYAKALRIYEYVADNFFYDNLGQVMSTYCCNPYLNLRALREESIGVNCSEGKVAIVCNGYASLIIALCRACGIPARMVNGSHISTVKAVWNNYAKDYRSAVTHWWSEVYIDGRWVIIDANRGSGNNWIRSDPDDPGKWKKWDSISYAGFDMKPYAIAGTHYYLEVPKSLSVKKNYPAPEVLAADTASGYVALSWDEVTGANGYCVYRGEDLGAIEYLTSVRAGDGTSWLSLDDIEEAGRTYYYRVAAKFGNVIGSMSKTVSACVSETERENAHRPPILDAQPASVSAPIGGSADFTAAARNGILSYQWQARDPGEKGWYDISASASGYAGVDTPTLSVSADAGRDGMQYRCRLGNEGGETCSQAAVLTVYGTPDILAQTLSVTASPDGTATFLVMASGESLHYQWQYFNTDKGTWNNVTNSGYSGLKTATMTAPATLSRNGMQYRCVVSNEAGSCFSSVATLNVG
ncbi:MAG: transglutaminase domain-containing protein [Oscillospiraceae bacterium]|nr:transglutaminase domain-containing protein [Oscillospiraceae bacterium]